MERINKYPKYGKTANASRQKTSMPKEYPTGEERLMLRREQRVYHPLPPTIFNPSTVDDEEVAGKFQQKCDDNAPKNIKEFLADVAAASGKRAQDFQAHMILDKRGVSKGKKKFANHKKPFSSADKRRLGLHLLPKKGLKFEQFVPLHAMWKEYMMNFMNVVGLKAIGFQGLSSDSRWTEFSLQLLKADYHGAFLTVTRSRCPGNVGASGIVVTDTKNTFNLIGRDDVVRIIPKDTSVFLLTLDDFKLELFGKYLCIRPAERSVKKIKSRMSADL